MRRLWLVAFAVAGVIVSTALPGGASPVADGPGHARAVVAKRPNIVLILLDDARSDEMRFLPKTQKLIARHGAIFTSLLAAHPLCCPARATLTTGQYGQNNGVHNNTGRFGGYHALRSPDNNVGHWLQKAGYHTAYIGKYLNGYRKKDGRPKGWDVWKPLVNGIYSYWDYRFYKGPAYHHRYITHTLTDQVRSEVTRFHRSSKPFFLFVNQTAPHDALNGHFGPPKFEPRYAHTYGALRSLARHSPAFGVPGRATLPSDLRKIGFSPEREDLWQRARARALRSADDSIAAMVHTLKKAHELGNTEFVVTSDNGFQLGEHRWVGKNLLFRESLQVPMMIRGPGMKAGSHDHQLITQADITAQIVKWAHAKAGRRPDGLPFDKIGRRRTTLLIQTGDESRDKSPGWWYRGVRTDRYTLGVRETGHGGPGGILYDHRRDPYELHNRWNDGRYRRVKAALLRRFHKLQSCSGASCNPAYGPLPDPHR